MTRLKIKPGVCGLATVVLAERAGRREVNIELRSACEAVTKLGESLDKLTMQDLFVRILDNVVYRAASQVLKHSSCPVPSGILKVAEVELELALPRDVSMEFHVDEPDKAS